MKAYTGAILLFCIIPSLAALPSEELPLSRAYQDILNRYYNEEAPGNLLADEFAGLDIPSGLPLERERYWRAWLLFGEGLLLAEENEDQAEEALEEGDRIVSNLLKGEGLSSQDRADYLALLSNIRSQLMLIKGIGYIIQNASKVNALAEEAVALDPDNVEALLIIAQGKMNAPGIFGGDINRAESILKELTERGELSQSFLSRLLLAMIYKKKNKPELRREYAASALKIFPRNSEARALEE